MGPGIFSQPLGSIPFHPLSEKIQTSFSGGSMTGDGGLLLLWEVDKKMWYAKQVGKLINDARHQSCVQHNITRLLRRRVYVIAAGYEDVNDHNYLCHDECFQISVGCEVKLAHVFHSLYFYMHDLKYACLMNMSRQNRAYHNLQCAFPLNILWESF